MGGIEAQGSSALRGTVIFVARLNLAYFAVEFTVNKRIGSVSLFADSLDFLEDASLNILIAVALGWGASNRARFRHGAGGYSADSRRRNPLDGAKAASSAVPRTLLLLSHGSRCADRQSLRCPVAGPISAAQRQPHSCGVSFRTQRCSGKYRHDRDCGGHSLYAFRMARLGGRTGNRGPKCRCRAERQKVWSAARTEQRAINSRDYR